jgi:hypothetical protein
MRSSGLALAGLLAVSTLFPLPGRATDNDAACADAPAVTTALARAWTMPADMLEAGRSAAAAPAIRPGQRADARLDDETRVTLQAPGRRTAGQAGIFALGVPASGLYRVMSSARAWIEIVAPDGRPLPVFMRPLRCLRGEGVQKELIYRLEAGVAYRLEISAVAEAQVGLMVIAEPAP